MTDYADLSFFSFPNELSSFLKLAKNIINFVVFDPFIFRASYAINKSPL